MWKTRGLRGSAFEEMIDMTNQLYAQRGLAVIQKVPTPITPIEVDNKARTITSAYFEKKSTVDFIGVVQGIAICFDAKETRQKSFPISNIHRHQIEFMGEFVKQKGIAFMLVNFMLYDQYFFLPFEQLKVFWGMAQSGARKSIPYESFDKKYLVEYRGGYLHYLDAINVYLEEVEQGVLL